MKKFNIPKIKLPELKEETKDKLASGAKITAKTLLTLCILGAAVKGCNSGCHAIMDQRKKVRDAQEEADKKTFATLIDKKARSRAGDSAMYFLDLDGNPATTEAVVLDGWDLFEESARFRDMTNGTVKSVAEWKKIAKLPQYFKYIKLDTQNK